MEKARGSNKFEVPSKWWFRRRASKPNLINNCPTYMMKSTIYILKLMPTTTILIWI